MPYNRHPTPEGEFDRRWADQELREIGDAIAIIEEAMAQLTVSGYGGARQEADVLLDIPASPNFITLPFDTLNPVASRGFSVNLVNETFTFDVEATWRVGIYFNLAGIGELNQSRNFEVRIYNVDDAVAATQPLSVPVSRNQGDIWFSSNVLFDVPASLVGKNLRVELGNGDSVSGGTILVTGVGVNSVTELKSLL